MNRLNNNKRRELFRLFGEGLGVRAAARRVGCHRDTAMRVRRSWNRARLQMAYDAMYEGNCDLCDRMVEDLPDDQVQSMFDNWMDDVDEGVTTKSIWF